MIELTQVLQKALDSEENPVRMVDPRTSQEYVIVRADVYEKLAKLVAGFTRSAGWDDPSLDVYEEYRNR